mmetsp:Transcript_4459/g.10501  ORF Transcript_4459/g.10501 Transcript_4459/m.10501 type:complete len:379 (+) Transcript_4459:92-1228(+)
MKNSPGRKRPKVTPASREESNLVWMCGVCGRMRTHSSMKNLRGNKKTRLVACSRSLQNIALALNHPKEVARDMLMNILYSEKMNAERSKRMSNGRAFKTVPRWDELLKTLIVLTGNNASLSAKKERFKSWKGHLRNLRTDFESRESKSRCRAVKDYLQQVDELYQHIEKKVVGFLNSIVELSDNSLIESFGLTSSGQTRAQHSEDQDSLSLDRLFYGLPNKRILNPSSDIPNAVPHWDLSAKHPQIETEHYNNFEEVRQTPDVRIPCTSYAYIPEGQVPKLFQQSILNSGSSKLERSDQRSFSYNQAAKRFRPSERFPTSRLRLTMPTERKSQRILTPLEKQFSIDPKNSVQIPTRPHGNKQFEFKVRVPVHPRYSSS